jgi:hypothetical protein
MLHAEQVPYILEQLELVNAQGKKLHPLAGRPVVLLADMDKDELDAKVGNRQQGLVACSKRFIGLAAQQRQTCQGVAVKHVGSSATTGCQEQWQQAELQTADTIRHYMYSSI